MFRSTPHKCTHWESTSVFWLQFPYLQTAQDELAKTWQTLKSSCLHHFKYWVHQMWKLLIPSFSMPRFGLVSLTHAQALMLVETGHPPPRSQPQSFLMWWGWFWAWDGVLCLNHFSIAVMKHHDQDNLGKQELIWACFQRVKKPSWPRIVTASGGHGSRDS